MPLSDQERFDLDKELFKDFPGVGQTDLELSSDKEAIEEPISVYGSDEPFPGYYAMLAEGKRRRQAGERDPHEISDGMSHISPRRQDRLSSEDKVGTEAKIDIEPHVISTPRTKSKPGYRTQAQRNARAHEAQARRYRRGK